MQAQQRREEYHYKIVLLEEAIVFDIMSAQADDKQQPTTNSISGIGESPTWRINSRSPDGLHSQSLSTRPTQKSM